MTIVLKKPLNPNRSRNLNPSQFNSKLKGLRKAHNKGDVDIIDELTSSLKKIVAGNDIYLKKIQDLEDGFKRKRSKKKKHTRMRSSAYS